MPNFHLGAHAIIRRMALLTRDAARYRSYFPALTIQALLFFNRGRSPGMLAANETMANAAGVLGAVIGVFAAGCWGSAVVHWVWMLGHRRPEISLATLLFFGFKAYDSSNFLPSGLAIHRRFIYSVVGFALAVLAGIGVSILMSATSR